MLDKTLYRGDEFNRNKSDHFHVLRWLTMLLPNAREVSKANLDSDTAVMKIIFKASGGGKGAVGGGVQTAGAGGKASRDGRKYVAGGRNPHQFFENGAFSKCRHCKTGGHRVA